MKKLVIKTALFTVLGVITVIGILFGVFALFFPKNLASFADRMGNYGVSVFYYEKAFEKSSSTKDLYDLVVVLNEKTDSVKTSQYANELIQRNDFGAIEKGGTPSTEEYVCAKYAISLFFSGQTDRAINYCKESVLLNGYTEYNAFTASISVSLNNLSKEDATKVLIALQSVKSELQEASQISLINSDILLVGSYING